MASLSAFTERQDKKHIVHLIDSKNTTKGLPRPYLGMSQLGGKCMRALWYYFRWVAEGEVDGRVNRIFQTGHKAEADMVRDLESIGVECWDTLDAQDAFVCVSGHCKGHGDGKAKGIPGAEKTIHLLEFKTANDKSFKAMEKNGVEKEKPTHYAQMILYMHFSKLTRALYMVYNKNDSSYYTERVHSNEKFAKELITKAENIVMAEEVNEFPKIGNGSKTWYECKFCDYKEVCFNEQEGIKNCRTCKYVDIIQDGGWECSINKDHLSIEEQALGCDNHELLNCLKVK